MFIARAMCVLTYVTVVALCSSCSLQKYLGSVTAALNAGGRSVSVVMKSPKIRRIEIQFTCISNIHCLCTVSPITLDVGIIASVCSLPNSPS